MKSPLHHSSYEKHVSGSLFAGSWLAVFLGGSAFILAGLWMLRLEAIIPGEGTVQREGTRKLYAQYDGSLLSTSARNGDSISTDQNILHYKRDSDTPFFSSKVKSPLNGTLTGLHLSQPGEPIRSGQHLCTIIPDKGDWIVHLRVPESNAGRVRPGLPVRLQTRLFRTQPGEEISGEVIQLLPSPTKDDSGHTRYTVLVRITHTPAPLLSGASLTGEIILGKHNFWQHLFEKFTGGGKS